jgi:hypothetical protein
VKGALKKVEGTFKCKRCVRGHSYRLLQGFCRVDVQKHSFTEGVIKVLKGPSARPSDFCSVKRFLSFLYKVNLSKL